MKFKAGDIIKDKYGVLWYLSDEIVVPAFFKNKRHGDRLFKIYRLISGREGSYRYFYEGDIKTSKIASDNDIINELVVNSLNYEFEGIEVGVDLEGPYFHISDSLHCEGVSLTLNQLREFKNFLNEFNI